MVVGIGVDIVRVSRFQKWVENPRLSERFFHPQELSVLERGEKAACQSLAVRFAAKEAFGKALGVGLRGLLLRDICVTQNSSGRPCLELYGNARVLLVKSGANTVHLSLSHEDEYAVAYVILECGE